MVTGLVSSVESSTVLIGIYDPIGLPAGFHFGTINSDLEFSTNFLVKSGVNFRTEGTYSVKAHYGESEAKSFFDYYENIPDTTIIEQSSVDNESSTSSSEKSEITNFFSDNSSSQIDSQSKTNSDEQILNEKHLENEKQDNLSVEDIELDKILNQINLECNNNKFADTITYYDGMGPALYRLCNFEISLNFFNDSLIKDPENVEVLVNKDSTLGKLGYYSESIEYYNQAIKVNPEFLPAKNSKANALAYLGNEKEAIMIYEEILDANPNYITARKNLEILKSEFNEDVQTISKNFESTPIVYTTTESKSPEITKQIIQQKEKPSNFFDEVSVVLGSLFGFLN